MFISVQIFLYLNEFFTCIFPSFYCISLRPWKYQLLFHKSLAEFLTPSFEKYPSDRVIGTLH